MTSVDMIFDILGREPKAIDIIDISLDLPNRTCTVEFIYNPYENPSSFTLYVYGIRELRWHVQEKISSVFFPADVVYLILGKENYQEICDIVTPDFNIEILYEKIIVSS